MRQLRIAFVSAFPPSTGPLSEYAWHLVETLRANPRVGEVHVLADRAPGAMLRQNGNLSVIPCWSFGGVDLPLSVLTAARRLQVDLLWFNQHLTSSGNTRRSWFVGLSAPAAARAAGFTTIVTLHNMLGLTDLDRAGISIGPLDVWGAHAATKMVGMADAVCVLRPEYADLLNRQYGMRHVHYMPHGTLGHPVTTPPSGASRGILAFGHFGGYKRLEPLIDAVAELSDAGAGLELWIGGSDSRHNPGYLDRMRSAHASRKNVVFLGYVPEPDVPALFQRAAVSALPYATMTGMSGVVIQSAMYGVPMVASDIAPFRRLEREGLRMSFYEWLNVESLKAAIRGLLDSPAARRRQAEHNLLYCNGQRMEVVVDGYLDLAEDLVSHRRHAAMALSGS